MRNIDESARSVFLEALHHLNTAIGLLDRSEAPCHIAAHVDLAVNQLYDALNPADQPCSTGACN